MGTDGDGTASPRGWWPRTFRLARHGAIILLALLVVEVFVVPKLVAASRSLYLLGHLHIGWLVGGCVAEAASLFCYALLTRTLLPPHGPSLSRVLRIDLSTAAVSHVVPAGSAGSAALGYRLLTAEGVAGATAGFVLGTQAIGSAAVLNVMLWLSLVVSIPLAGIHAIYVVVLLVGLILLSGVAVLAYLLTQGEAGSVRVVRAVGKRIPRVGADRLEGAFLQIGKSLQVFLRDPDLRRRAVLWAALNWLLDAGSLWLFVAALGSRVDPVELFAAYGIANVLGALPITPGGLGIIEASVIPLLVSAGCSSSVATFGVVGWRLVNFWLPIPVGAGTYISLRSGRSSGIRAKREALSELATYTHSDHPSVPKEGEGEGNGEGDRTGEGEGEGTSE